MKMLAATITLLGALSNPAVAAPQDVANDISQHIMSPFCPGVTLHDCPSDSAVALRDRITGLAEEGFSRAQIMDQLIAEYGNSIRAEPPRSGSGLVAWLLPAVAALGAAGLAWSLLRRWAHDPERMNGYDPDRHLAASDQQRLDAELDRLRGPA